MANPEHTPSLDNFDRATVRLYRAGLVWVGSLLLATALWGLGLASWLGMSESLETSLRVLGVCTSGGMGLVVVNLHLYDKRIRWVIPCSAVFGLWLQCVGLALPESIGQHVLCMAGLGFVYVALSAVTLKEQFCFRIPGLKWSPLFLATSLIPGVMGEARIMGLILLPSAILTLTLAVAKIRMPLGHDVGDKSRYQV